MLDSNAVVGLGIDQEAIPALGLTRPRTRSGTAEARMACLSPMEAELSIMRRRSILLILLCGSFSWTVEVIFGSLGSRGRLRHLLTYVTPETPVKSTSVPVNTGRRNPRKRRESAMKELPLSVGQGRVPGRMSALTARKRNRTMRRQGLSARP